MTTREVLLGAAEYLRKYGWIQWETGNHGGPRCALGALESVDIDSVYDDAEYRLLRTVGASSVVKWNDAPGRTVEEVIAAFEKAAAECES